MKNNKKIPVTFISNLVYRKSITSLMKEEEEQDTLSIQDALEVLKESGVEMDEETLLKEYEKEELNLAKNKLGSQKGKIGKKSVISNFGYEYRLLVAIGISIGFALIAVFFSPTFEPLRKMEFTGQVKKNEELTDFTKEFIKMAFSYTPKNFDYQLDAVLSYSNEKCKDQIFQYIASDPALRSSEWKVYSINSVSTSNDRLPSKVTVNFTQRIINSQGTYQEKAVELILRIQKADKTPFNRFGMKVQDIEWVQAEK